MEGRAAETRRETAETVELPRLEGEELLRRGGVELLRYGEVVLLRYGGEELPDIWRGGAAENCC